MTEHQTHNYHYRAHYRRLRLFNTPEIIGNKPTSMFLAGIHGDESGVCPLLQNLLNRFHQENRLDNYVSIPAVNPSAIKKNRRGLYGTNIDDPATDINRKTVHRLKRNRIIRELISYLEQYPDINTLFSFHEETDTKGYKSNGDNNPIEEFNRGDAFYLYDAHQQDDKTPPIEYAMLIEKLQEKGFSIYNGLDAYSDIEKQSVQMNEVNNGYCLQTGDTLLDGTFENYFVRSNNFKKEKRSFVFEIPHNLSSEKKTEMMEIIFNIFIIPYLKRTSSN